MRMLCSFMVVACAAAFVFAAPASAGVAADRAALLKERAAEFLKEAQELEALAEVTGIGAFKGEALLLKKQAAIAEGLADGLEGVPAKPEEPIIPPEAVPLIPPELRMPEMKMMPAQFAVRGRAGRVVVNPDRPLSGEVDCIDAFGNRLAGPGVTPELCDFAGGLPRPGLDAGQPEIFPPRLEPFVPRLSPRVPALRPIIPPLGPIVPDLDPPLPNLDPPLLDLEPRLLDLDPPLLDPRLDFQGRRLLEDRLRPLSSRSGTNAQPVVRTSLDDGGLGRRLGPRRRFFPEFFNEVDRQRFEEDVEFLRGLVPEEFLFQRPVIVIPSDGLVLSSFGEEEEFEDQRFAEERFFNGLFFGDPFFGRRFFGEERFNEERFNEEFGEEEDEE